MTALPVSASSAFQYPINFMQNEISKKSFDERFKDALKCDTDELEPSTDKSITCFNVGDCLAVFGKTINDKGKVEIFGYHIDADTEKDEMVYHLEGCSNDLNKYDLYIIGGNSRTEETGTLKELHLALKEHFGNNGTIKGEFTNLNAGTRYKLISVNFQLNGTLTFCRF